MGGWVGSVKEHRKGKGIDIDFRFGGVHARRVIMRGELTSVEVQYEWGLSIYRDTADSYDKPLVEKTIRRTELNVHAHYVDAGRVLPDGSQGEPPDADCGWERLS